MTVLDNGPARRIRDDDDFVLMQPWLDCDESRSDPREQRRNYLQLLRDQTRLDEPTLALPVQPVVGRGQFEVVPPDVKAKVPPNKRVRKLRIAKQH